MVKEREEKLKKINFPKDNEAAVREAVAIQEIEEEDELTPEDTEMKDQMGQEEKEEPEVVVIDVDDERTSREINYERLKVDLADYSDPPAFCIDPDDRVSRYVLYKVADSKSLITSSTHVQTGMIFV